MNAIKAILVEDEIAAGKNLIDLLYLENTEIEIVEILDSVKSAIRYFRKNRDFDLVFMDVHLGDGICFEIFEKIELNTPIIFTTAYDQYAIETFKVNSLYYLLKPIRKKELIHAITKFKKNTYNGVQKEFDLLLENLKAKRKKYHSTLLIPNRGDIIPVKVKNFAFFYIKTGIVRGITFSQESFTFDKKIQELEKELDPESFYRVNRQFIINRDAVDKINYPFYGKIKVTVTPEIDDSIIISKAKAKDFKNWLMSN
ncbi:LytTR family DNA-binding domain-containing protein [Aquimarina sp. RZ0]|uniref:LytR/AlgR family response regulator transcription factor n=1 Tax=Aquimarina sp. RZ0 TaxID=2607730 RepID=UPI0011F150F9|nr:LytTR family DNA-binding domain-containing protein [Aquimarina sp. RZ0]KAA1244451.1 response regulator transcription factor [Aquimarina sp. RZ0]